MNKEQIMQIILKMREDKITVKRYLQNEISKEELENKKIKLHKI